MSIVFAISGGFRSSRSSVVNLTCKLLEGLYLATPYTTRPQIVDRQGDEFVFTSREVFERMIAREEFLEYVNILGNYYGTPLHDLQHARAHGKDLLVAVDDLGVVQVKQKVPHAVSILILPGRPAEDTETLRSLVSSRVPTLLQEMILPSLREVLSTSETPNPDKYDEVIVNDGLESSANKLIKIIRSERLRNP
jgi:guanylate kinase